MIYDIEVNIEGLRLTLHIFAESQYEAMQILKERFAKDVAHITFDTRCLISIELTEKFIENKFSKIMKPYSSDLYRKEISGKYSHIYNNLDEDEITRPDIPTNIKK